jgi:hypothetical protein
LSMFFKMKALPRTLTRRLHDKRTSASSKVPHLAATQRD